MTSLRHRLIAISLISVVAGGCTTTEAVRQPQSAKVATLVKPGDVIDCTLRDGTDWKFKIVRVEPDALIGATQQVKVQDLTYLKIKRFSPGKTILAVVGIAGVCFMAAGAVEMAPYGFPAYAGP